MHSRLANCPIRQGDVHSASARGAWTSQSSQSFACRVNSWETAPPPGGSQARSTSAALHLHSPGTLGTSEADNRDMVSVWTWLYREGKTEPKARRTQASGICGLHIGAGTGLPLGPLRPVGWGFYRHPAPPRSCPFPAWVRLLSPES